MINSFIQPAPEIYILKNIENPKSELQGRALFYFIFRLLGGEKISYVAFAFLFVEVFGRSKLVYFRSSAAT